MAVQQPKPVNKIVLTFGPAMATIGINGPACDPHFTVMELAQGEDAATPLEQVLERLPAAIHGARERWDAQARNPAYQRPAPSIQPAAGAEAARTGRPTPVRPSNPTQQSLM